MAELRAYNPSYRERIGNAIYDMLVGTGLPANRMRNEAQAAMDFVPGLGDVIGVNDAARDYQAGDYVGAGVGGLATVLGMVPMVGDAAGKAVKKAKEPIKKGIKAFHGSPHDFDRFSLDKIGTGEGAQAYGHGLYFAESEGVAKSYRDNLLDARIPDVNDRLKQISDKMQEISTGYRQWRSGQEGLGKELAAEYDSLMDARSSMKGRMYEVNINANPDDFLDWDKPLSEQPRAVLDALNPMIQSRLDAIEAAGQRARLMASEKGLPDFTPKSREQLYQEMRGGDIVGASKLGQFDQRAEQVLAEQGIPGIKYLDAGSRGAGDGSRNYVVFDDSLIEIVRKYGIAAAIAGGVITREQAEQMQAQGAI